jgi:hypothetical protein
VQNVNLNLKSDVTASPSIGKEQNISPHQEPLNAMYYSLSLVPGEPAKVIDCLGCIEKTKFKPHAMIIVSGASAEFARLTSQSTGLTS